MRPTAITADKTRATLVITWDDGLISELPFGFLSAWCPCAVCTEQRNASNPRSSTPATSVELEAIQPVGSYAINIVWKDGCRYGIYTWEYLRELDAMQRGMRP